MNLFYTAFLFALNSVHYGKTRKILRNFDFYSDQALFVIKDEILISGQKNAKNLRPNLGGHKKWIIKTIPVMKM